MPSKSFKKSLLAVSIIAMSVPSFAQTPSQDESLEEVVVTGMRSSLNTAQELKRNADTVKDVITSTDIGALPDKSVTEALQRVPGVTIERFASSDDPKHYADEGTGVLVRGLDRVRSEINGRGSFSANPYGGLSYEDFPAELLGAVEVVKNQTADLGAGGIAGTVNLITRKPFDSDEQLVSFSAKANYGDLREELTPSFTALFSDSWETSAGNFGFLVAGSQSEFATQGDSIGLGNYHSRGVIPFSYDIWGTPVPGVVGGLFKGPCVPNAQAWGSGCGVTAGQYTKAEGDAYVPPYEGGPLPGQAAGVTYYTPANFHIGSAENDRERTGFTTSLQWANTDETITATLEHINSVASLEWRERIIASGDRGFLAGNPNALQWSDDSKNNYPMTFDSNGFLTSGVARNTSPDFPLQFRSRYNYNENTVEDTSFNLELKPSDRLTATLDYQHIDSDQTVSNYGLTSRINGNQTSVNAPFFLDLRGDTPSIKFLDRRTSYPPDVAAPVAGATPTAPRVFTNPILRLASGMQQEVRANASADNVKLDFQYDLDGVFTAVKTGLLYSEKELKIGDTEYQGFSPLGTPWQAEASYNASPQVVPELFERVSFADHYGGDVLQGIYNSFLFPRMDLTQNYVSTLRDGCGKWSALGNANDGSGRCALPYEDLNDRIDGNFGARHLSSSNETRAEFYVRGDFEFEDLAVPIKGNAGLRYVNYQIESTGFLVLPETSRRGTAPRAATATTPAVPASSRYTVMQSKYPEIFALASGGAVQNTVDGTDYNTVLPSLNLSFGVAEDVVARFGASMGIYFPGLRETRNSNIVSLDFDEVKRRRNDGLDDNPASPTYNPVVDLENIEISGASSNPFLEPEESLNLDLTAEWYFAPAGSLSAGVFHKKLDNIIRNKQFGANVNVAERNYPVSAYGPDNTGSGTIQGIELSYSQFYDMLPGAWSGLGLQLNYTFIDQSGLEDPNDPATAILNFTERGVPITDNRNSFRVFSNLPLQGYSDQNLNVVGMYEYEDFSFRLAYTWRSEYLLTLRESEEFVPAYSKAQGMLDSSFYYTINENWKVGIEGSNLLNATTETQYQLDQGGRKTDALDFTTDRRYALSVRANF